MKKRKLRGGALLGAMAVVATSFGAGPAYGYTIRILGTSDITDSQLYANRIQNAYSTSPYFVAGDTLSYTASGSGQALTSAEQGFGDVVLVHSPSAEALFTGAGYSYEPLGRSLFYNDYFVAGPTGDPAKVTSLDPNNAVGAFQDVANWGTTNSNATFVSRDDASGTNVKEEQMWTQTTGVPIQPALNNPSGVAGLSQPVKVVGGVTVPGSYPAWYVTEPSSGQHQGQNLINTSSCSTWAGRTGCYTLVDNGTYDFEATSGNIPNLQAVVSRNALGPGGTSELVNPFHAYIVTPIDPAAGSGGIYPSGVTPNVTAATRFVNFLTGATGASGAGSTGLSGEVTFPEAFQDSLSTYLPSGGGGLSGGPIVKDASPTVKNAVPSGVNTPVAHGATIHVSANLVYAPPPTPAVSGIPYSFQESYNNSSTWTVIGSGNSGTTGLVTGSFTLPNLGDTAQIRLWTPSYLDNPVATLFSPHNDQLDFGTFKATT
jgi:ABC-type tungstate transport system permease subunit